MSGRPVGDRLVMSPMEAVVAGGAAAAFERQPPQLYRGGYRRTIRIGAAGALLRITPTLTFDRMSVQKARAMSVEIRAGGRTFATAHIENVFARNQIVFEPRGADVKSVAWQHPQRERP
jgi:hypothetical protein